MTITLTKNRIPDFTLVVTGSKVNGKASQIRFVQNTNLHIAQLKGKVGHLCLRELKLSGSFHYFYINVENFNHHFTAIFCNFYCFGQQLDQSFSTFDHHDFEVCSGSSIFLFTLTIWLLSFFVKSLGQKTATFQKLTNFKRLLNICFTGNKFVRNFSLRYESYLII